MTGARVPAWLLARWLRFDLGRTPGRLVTVFAAAFVVAVIGVATIAVPQVLAAQEERAMALTPALSTSAEGAEDVLRMLYLDPTEDRRWNGHDITRYHVVEGSTQDSQVLGIGSWPRAREYYASPALTALIDQDPVVAALFRGHDQIGSISSAGLVHPQELRAVVGVAEGRHFSRVVEGFGEGSRPDPDADLQHRLGLAVAVIAGSAVWVPTIGLLAIAIRLGSPLRRRRVRAACIVGLSRSASRGLVVAEIVPATATGAAAGVLAASWWTANMSFVPGAGVGYHPEDAHLGLLVVLGVGLVVVGAAMLGVVLDTSDRSSARGRRAARVPRWHRSGLALLTGGLVYLAAMGLIYRLAGWSATIGMWLAVGAVMVGIASSGPSVAARLAERVASRARSGGVLVGARMVAQDVPTSQRLGSVVAVVLVAALTSISFVNVLGGTTEESPEWSDPGHLVPVRISGLGEIATLGDVSRGLEGPVAAWIPGPDGEAGRVVATCRTVEALAAGSLGGCRDLPAWLTIDGQPATAAAVQSAQDVVPGVPPGDAVIELGPVLPADWDGAIVVPPSAVADATTMHATFYSLIPAPEVRRSLAEVSAVDPLAQFSLEASGLVDPDSARYVAERHAIVGSVAVAVVIAVLGLLALIAGEVQDRRSRMRGLRLLGAPPRALWTAHFFSSAVPVLVIGGLGILGGLAAQLAIRSFDARAVVEWHLVVVLCLACVATSFASAVLTWPGVRSATSRGGGLEV